MTRSPHGDCARRSRRRPCRGLAQRVPAAPWIGALRAIRSAARARRNPRSPLRAIRYVRIGPLIRPAEFSEKSRCRRRKPERLAASPCAGERWTTSRSSRNVGAGCDGRCGVRCVKACRTRRRVRYGDVVWLAPRPWRHPPPCGNGNGDKKRRSPGRARSKPLNIAWGKPGCLGCTCSPRPCASHMGCPCALAHGIYGRSQRPAFPAPFLQERDNEIAKLGQTTPRDRCFTSACFPSIPSGIAAMSPHIPSRNQGSGALHDVTRRLHQPGLLSQSRRRDREAAPPGAGRGSAVSRSSARSGRRRRRRSPIRC